MVREWIVGEFFFSLRKEIDTEWVFIDGSYIRCHQHASGARLGFDRAIGQSHGGRTTKIHLCCDADGYPLDFKVTGGEVHDSQVAPKLIELVGSAEYLIEPSRDCRRPKTLRQYPYEKQTIPNRS